MFTAWLNRTMPPVPREGGHVAEAKVDATPPKTVPPRPQALLPRVAQSEIAEYRAVAERIGVMNGALKRELVLHELAEMGLRVFNYDDVEAYLDGLFGKGKAETEYREAKTTWGWRPLRVQDGMGIQRDAAAVARNPNNDFLLRSTYQFAVPLPVLLTVERLEAAVPELHFFVSDKSTAADEKEDPFLAVTSPGMPMLVIERWDEPNFKG